MRNTDRIRRAVEDFAERLRTFGEVAFPEENRDGTSRIRSREERKMVIRFMTEVYHQGQDEHVWAAKHPEEYARILQIAGTVPAPREGE